MMPHFWQGHLRSPEYASCDRAPAIQPDKRTNRADD